MAASSAKRRGASSRPAPSCPRPPRRSGSSSSVAWVQPSAWLSTSCCSMRERRRLLRRRVRYSSAPATAGTRGKPTLLGELPADLEVGVDARLEPAEQLQDQPVAVDDRRVALLAVEPADLAACRRRRAAPRRPAVWLGADGAAPRRGSAPGWSSALEQRAREAIVEPGVEQHALARAGDRARARRAARALRRPWRRRRRRSVERQEVAGRARRPRTRLRRSSGRAAAAPRRSSAPVDEPGAARSRRALPPNQRWRWRNGQQQLALDQRPDVAVEQRVPGGAHEAAPGACATSGGGLGRRRARVIGAGACCSRNQ